MAEAKRGFTGALDALKQAFGEWSGDRSPQIAAALAYYVLFSVAPLLVLATALAGLVYGRSGSSRLLGLVARFAGPRVIVVLQQILVAASRPRTGIIASIIGVLTLIFGATGAFTSVQSALNQIWEVQPRAGRGIRGVVRDRIPTFLLLAAVGIVLVASLAASTVLTGLAAAVPRFGVLGGVLAEALNLLLFVGVMTVIFAFVFKVLPDARIGWRDVWFGGLVTAALFALGQLVIGTYLSLVTVGSAYGAAGSLIAVLVWLYYSGIVFLFGAELTQVLAARHGSRIEPAQNAERLQQPCAPPQPGTGQPDQGAGGTRPAPQ